MTSNYEKGFITESIDKAILLPEMVSCLIAMNHTVRYVTHSTELLWIAFPLTSLIYGVLISRRSQLALDDPAWGLKWMTAMMKLEPSIYVGEVMVYLIVMPLTISAYRSSILIPTVLSISLMFRSFSRMLLMSRKTSESRRLLANTQYK
jgi:hypothetical protein